MYTEQDIERARYLLAEAKKIGDTPELLALDHVRIHAGPYRLHLRICEDAVFTLTLPNGYVGEGTGAVSAFHDALVDMASDRGRMSAYLEEMCGRITVKT